MKALPNEKLPKLWLGRIQKYWEKRIPKYPVGDSTVEFVTDPTEKEAVLDMESKLGTDESIIDPESIPENCAVGDYFGSYNIKVDAPSDFALVSPVKVDDGADYLVYKLAAPENNGFTWVALEYTISNGYIYASIDADTVVAVFSIRKDTYVDESKSQFAFNVFVCNGISVKVYKDAEDNIVAEDAYGKKTVIDATYGIVGGTYGETEVAELESTNVAICEGATVNYVVGGSWNSTSNEAVPTHVKNIKVTVKDATVTGTLTGAGLFCRADNVDITVENSSITNGLGCQMSYYKSKYSNKDLAESELKLLAKQWVKKSKITLNNVTTAVVYAAGNNGNSYTESAELYIDGGTYEYVCNAQSNGTVDNCYAEIKNANITHYNQINRGHCGYAAGLIKSGCEIEKAYLFNDPTEPDPSMADVKLARLDIDANNSIGTLGVGAISNVEITTYDVAKLFTDVLKVSRSTKVANYRGDLKAILKDKYVIK